MIVWIILASLVAFFVFVQKSFRSVEIQLDNLLQKCDRGHLEYQRNQKDFLVSKKQDELVLSVVEDSKDSEPPIQSDSHFDRLDPTQIHEFPNFLTGAECDQLIQMARPRLETSEVVGLEKN